MLIYPFTKAVYLAKYVNLLSQISIYGNPSDIFDYYYGTFLVPLNRLLFMSWYADSQNASFIFIDIDTHHI